ncbi:hypothetical protein EKO27_g3545 [Xylaria grammica]|uniref:Alpha-1,3/1,6-mannosyltransferase ALG2 n=1 Tax=Xylaria grammica TaxID=363999 RepID=A0A439DB28_9PEZI|nr:hypothetical protein EKO27_g3545 [Xylaria grammica]
MATNPTDKREETPSENGKTIAFLHPDLGIGGAERLVVDAAVGLQKRGHKVVIFTSHCDPGHCFDEARDGTLDIRVRGNTLIPPSLFGRFSILCAILRQLHLILQIYFTSELRDLRPDAYFVDQLSAGLPLLQYLQPDGRIFFYCHFPDLLLAQGRQQWLKRVYRVPFDFWEQWSMSFADAIAVNSNFTKGVVRRTWPALASQRDLWTVYPCVDTKTKEKRPGEKPLWNGMKYVLSINRFERKKDIALAIKAFAGLSKSKRASLRLAVAGGYDPRVAENVSYHNELVGLAESLGLRNMTVRTPQTAQAVPQDVEVLFLQNVTNMLKEMLLSSARLLVYTPANEHFGIVPLEAMLSGVPVLAADTGGPVETVVEGQTGWLRSPDKVDEWTEVMDKALHQLSPQDLAKMSEAGIERVKSGFGEAEMAQRLDSIFSQMLRTERPSQIRLPLLSSATKIMLIVGTLVLAPAVAVIFGQG